MAKKIYTEEEARQRKNERQQGYAKRTDYAAQRRYDKEQTKPYTFKFMRNTEADLIEHLEKQGNKSGYIKSLIREDMAKNGK